MVRIPTLEEALRTRESRFRDAFPEGDYESFFKSLEAKTGILIDEMRRCEVINACLALIGHKDGLTSGEELKHRLKIGREIKKESKKLLIEIDDLAKTLRSKISNLQTFESGSLLASGDDYEALVELVDSLRNHGLWRKLFGEAIFPVQILKLLLQSLSEEIGRVLSQHESSRGRPADEDLDRFIRRLANIFECAGGDVTSPWNEAAGMRASPFVSFVVAIHNALPGEARMGPAGVYSPAALEERIERIRRKRVG